ncbi:MAG: hypothetical protein LC122_12820 [Chitinophagales bacterium]|nr:hypothetical protein [Chitinophagales bacterium]
MTYSFGEVSWDSELEVGKKTANTKDLYLKLEPGDNEVRIITPAYQYVMHRYKANEDDKGYGVRINCSATKENGGDCPLCKQGDKVKVRWLVGVINRKTGKYQILDLAYQAMMQIKKLRDNARWGDPTKYDVNISVDPGNPSAYYTVQPLGKEPLSAEDNLIKDKADLDYLRSKASPLTPEQVKEKMENAAKFAEKDNKKGVQKPATKKVPVVKMDDEEFEDYAS